MSIYQEEDTLHGLISHLLHHPLCLSRTHALSKILKKGFKPWEEIVHSRRLVKISQNRSCLQLTRGKLLQAGNEPKAKLYLRPGDGDRKPVIAANVRTNDAVLKITVPKRTGLKRKRGSDDPFAEPSQESEIEPRKQAKPSTPGVENPLRNASRLLRSLRDSEGKYGMSIVGRIEETHRFRGMSQVLFNTKLVTK